MNKLINNDYLNDLKKKKLATNLVAKFLEGQLLK